MEVLPLTLPIKRMATTWLVIRLLLCAFELTNLGAGQARYLYSSAGRCWVAIWIDEALVSAAPQQLSRYCLPFFTSELLQAIIATLAEVDAEAFVKIGAKEDA